MGSADLTAVEEFFPMSTTKRNWATGYYAGFFWMGVVMTLACIALILAGNTETFYRLERTSFPLSWAFAGVAIFEFLAAEICHHYDSVAREAKDGRSRSARDREAIEAQSWL
jgi:uncharacterized membrane protein YoaT (DUF817 family)